MKSVKPSIDILKGHSTGVNMDVSAPHLIHKWLKESRQSPSFMLLAIHFFCAPRPSMSSKPTIYLRIAVTLRTAVLQLPLKSYKNRTRR